MHEESDSETEPVTINQCFGVVEPPCDFCDFHWGRLYWLYLFFFLRREGYVVHLTDQCIWCIRKSIWHISFPQQAHKTASTVKDTTYECIMKAIECYLSLGSRQVTRSPRADVKTCWVHQVARCCPNKAHGCGDLEDEQFFAYVFYSACFLWGWFLGFFCCCFLMVLLVLFFFCLDDFLHSTPKIRHKTSWSEEIVEVFFSRRWELFKSWLVNLPPHEPSSRSRNKACP